MLIHILKSPWFWTSFILMCAGLTYLFVYITKKRALELKELDELFNEEEQKDGDVKISLERVRCRTKKRTMRTNRVFLEQTQPKMSKEDIAIIDSQEIIKDETAATIATSETDKIQKKNMFSRLYHRLRSKVYQEDVNQLVIMMEEVMRENAKRNSSSEAKENGDLQSTGNHRLYQNSLLSPKINENSESVNELENSVYEDIKPIVVNINTDKLTPQISEKEQDLPRRSDRYSKKWRFF